MPKLHIEQKTVFKLDWLTYSHDHKKGLCGLEDFLYEVYGKPEGGRFFLDEAGNDTTHHASIKEKKPLDFYDQKCLDEYLRTGAIPEYALGTVLQDLVNKGKLTPGEYYVWLSW